LDSSSGDVVHVDFNCLFYKGLTFDKPEKVPFRLTPQMVDALGPLGYEGTFRQVCEVTMRQLRDNKDTLLSVLETFVYDPSFEGKNRALANRDMNGEETTEGLNILKGKF
jgi:serine/threonine-protein kinase ATR